MPARTPRVLKLPFTATRYFSVLRTRNDFVIIDFEG